jgi:hypothetical protein
MSRGSRDTIVIRRPTGQMTFGKYKGRLIRDLDDYHMKSIYWMPSTQATHPQTFEELTAEIDYRVVDTARKQRHEKFLKRDMNMWS